MTRRVVTCDGCGRDAKVSHDVPGANFCRECVPEYIAHPRPVVQLEPDPLADDLSDPPVPDLGEL